MPNLKVTVETDYNGKGIKEAQASLRDTERSIQQLKDKIKGLKPYLDNAAPDSAAFNRYSAAIGKAEAALQALQNKAKAVGTGVATNMGGATTSVIEFNRVIQDAPFGIQGVGNNVQSLTQNLAYLVTTTGSARKATSVFFSTLITPANLAVLAVSAITTAWTIYERQQQKAAKTAAEAAKDRAKALRDEKTELDDYIETLNVQDRISVKAAQSTGEEITKLRVLYGVTQDVTLGLKQRNRAADELQKIYPEQFKNQSNEIILTGQAVSAYDELTRSILASGRAKAAINVGSDLAVEDLKLSLRKLDIDKQRAPLLEKQASLQRAIKQVVKETEGQTGSVIAVKALADELETVNKALQDLTDQRTKDGLRQIKIYQEQKNILSLVNDEIKKGADITGKPGKDYTPKVKSGAIPTDYISKSLLSSAQGVASTGLDGFKKQVQDLSDEYEGYMNDIDKMEAARAKKGVNIESAAISAKQKLNEDYLKRYDELYKKETERVAAEVQRIRDDAGVQSEQSSEKEYANVVKWYDAEKEKAKGNADILAAIEEGALARRDAIREKYNEKARVAYEKLADKIKEIEDKPLSTNSGLPGDTDRINKEVQKRIDKLNDLYDAMIKLNGGDLMGLAQIFAMRAISIKGVQDTGNTALSGDNQSAKALNAAVGKFTSDMYDAVSNIGKKNAEITDKYNKARQGATDAEVLRLNQLEAKEKQLANSFGTIFSSIFDTFTNAMDSLFKQTLTNLLKTTFQKGLSDIKFDGLSSKISQGIVAGAALAGNAISSIGGGKNSVASAAGGALSGAASGAVIGTAVAGPAGLIAGAVIGGVGGIISGLFSASSKRQEEELQKQQLAEQKKTNELIERQNRLAYSSAIIGRMSDQGVITAVDVNEFGQLTAKISGNDIVLIYDRNKKAQNRKG